MQTQFTMQLVSGQMVSVTVETEVTHNCDCGGELHPHIEFHEIVDCTDEYTGLDVQMTDSERQEIEDYADEVVYAAIEAEEAA